MDRPFFSLPGDGRPIFRVVVVVVDDGFLSHVVVPIEKLG